MKQCPNPNCIIYTRLDELPDTYLRCPQCNSTLVDVEPPTTRVDEYDLDFEPLLPGTPGYTEPYSLLPRAQFTRQIVPEYHDVFVGEPVAPFDPGYEPPLEVETAPPVASGSRVPVRAIAISTAVFLVVVGCVVSALFVRNRIFPDNPEARAAVATATAVALMRPAVNTPIVPLPTIALLDSGGSVPAAAPPDSSASSNPSSSGPAAAPANTGPAPVEDALMCVRLDGGSPVGVTSAYKPSDAFILAVKAVFGSAGVSVVRTTWFGPDGAQVYEMRQAYSAPGDYYAGFTVAKSGPWSPGDYRVDIYTNGAPQPVSSVHFSVIP